MAIDVDSFDEGDEEESMQKDFDHSGKKSADLEFEKVKEPSPVKWPMANL